MIDVSAGEGKGEMQARIQGRRLVDASSRGGQTNWRSAAKCRPSSGLRAALVPGWLAVAVMLALGGPSIAAGQAANTGEHLIAAVSTGGSIHQPHGGEVLVAARAAADRINRAGGLLGRRVRIAGWTEDCTRERAAQVAEEIALLGPVLVVGHLCTGAAMAAAPIYASAGVLLIVPGVRHSAMTSAEARGLVLRLAGRDDRLARDTADFIAARNPGKGVAIVADRTWQATSIADSVARELARREITIGLNERIESNEKSYGPLAARIRASGAGVVFVPAQPIELGVLVASLREAGVEASIVGSEILAVPSLQPVVDREGSRLIVMLPWSGLEGADLDVMGTTAGAEIVEAGPGTGDRRERDALRARTEAAIELWAEAARRAGSVSAVTVAAGVRAAPVETRVGLIRFDEAGDAIVPGFVAHTWRGGTWRPLPDALSE
jgi:branched-chain amino acid transport system substrate-binding protein